MAVRTIRQLGDPILRRRCEPVDFSDRTGLILLVDDLKDTLRAFQTEHGTGRGIAAPQIGISRRVVFIEYGDIRLALCNPVIERVSPEQMEVWDSCFSYWGIVFKVQRHQRITVAYTDPDGNIRRLDAEGELSELLQHELEHLDGILAIDQRVTPGDIMGWTEYCRR